MHFAVLALAALGLAATAATHAQTQSQSQSQTATVVVYTAIEPEELKAYDAAFTKSVPNIELKWVRASRDAITARLIAEKANPQADVVWGLPASNLMLLDGEGMLQPYEPRAFKSINPRYRDDKAPPVWWGMDVYGGAVCFNQVEGAKRDVPRPESWQDLVKPAYKGQITMPNPATSGAGFLYVAAWLQLFGEDDGWKYMDALHQNIAMYTRSGARPCIQAGFGEYVIGLSFDHVANRVKAMGAFIDIVFPKEGMGWEMETFAILKGTPKLVAAQKVADWAAGTIAMEEYAKVSAIVSIPGMVKQPLNIPSHYERMLIKNDFAWAAKNRQRILDEWKKRYGDKAEK